MDCSMRQHSPSSWHLRAYWRRCFAGSTSFRQEKPQVRHLLCMCATFRMANLSSFADQQQCWPSEEYSSQWPTLAAIRKKLLSFGQLEPLGLRSVEPVLAIIPGLFANGLDRLNLARPSFFSLFLSLSLSLSFYLFPICRAARRALVGC